MVASPTQPRRIASGRRGSGSVLSKLFVVLKPSLDATKSRCLVGALTGATHPRSGLALAKNYE